MLALFGPSSKVSATIGLDGSNEPKFFEPKTLSAGAGAPFLVMATASPSI